MSDKEHFDKMLLKELAWKLDREVWAHVQNPSPSEEWSTSKAREETRKLCAEYLGNIDDLQAQLSSLQAENERLKTWEETARKMDEVLHDYAAKNIELGKRCEDLEAILDNNGLSWTYKKLSH